MKKFYAFLCLFLLCILLCACTGAKRYSLLTSVLGGRTAAVVDIAETERSKIDIPETSAVTTLPQYFEVVATAATAATTKKNPAKTEPVKEYFTVKFVDIDGYTAISVQTVAEGDDATEPPMPKNRGDLVFRGWDKDFTNIKSGTVVKAIYQKEWLTVRFFDADATLLKEAKVRYGETATAPEVSDKGDYLFDGWSTTFNNITEDLNVYATYYIREMKETLALVDAFSMFDVSENTIGLPVTAYYRKEYPNPVKIGKTEHLGNIIHGNFCDMLPIEGYGFTALEGTLMLYRETDFQADEYLLKFYIYVDGSEVYSAELDKLGTSKNFSVDISGAKEVTLRLETLVDGFLHYGDTSFVGGLVNTSFVE